MQRHAIPCDYLSTLCWTNNCLIDWASAGKQFCLDGQSKEIGKYHFAFSFDAAISSADGTYAVIYKKLGTKALLLKNGEILREINRSYYHAETYEYPIAFAKLKDGRDILIHCPKQYCRLDFEEVETGLLLTEHSKRAPADFFHSRLEVSADNQTLLSKGWAWQPFDFVEVFDIQECLQNPLALDRSKFTPNVAGEISAAGFISNDSVLIASPIDPTEADNLDPSDLLQNGDLGIWNIKTNEIKHIVKAPCVIGAHLIPIDQNTAWSLYEFPKIIDFINGKIIAEYKDIPSGKQTSAIMHHVKELPFIAFNKQKKHLAIGTHQQIEILHL